MSGNILCLQTDEQIFQAYQGSIVSFFHRLMNEPGCNECLSGSGTSYQEEIVCPAHPRELTQLPKLSAVQSFCPVEIILIQSMPGRSPATFIRERKLFRSLSPTSFCKAGKQKLRIGRLLFLCLMYNLCHVFSQTCQFQTSCIFDQFFLRFIMIRENIFVRLHHSGLKRWMHARWL